jgi:hypothetical protein
MVSHGTVSIYGSQVTSFVAVPTAANAHATTIDLGSTPVGWKSGDRLIVTGDTATNSNDVNQDEEVALMSISGSVITLDKALKYNHTAGSVYVANVSRNAVFESENVVDVAHRGHVMFMHSANVHVDSAGFYGLGRTDKRTLIDDPVLVPDTDHPGQMTTDVLTTNINPDHPELGHRVLVPVVDAHGKPVTDANGVVQLQIARTGLNPRGRYAVHFHRTGTGSAAATITGSAVVDTPGWGIVNHSSNVDVSNNVVFNAVGAAYVTEAGDEIGSFDHNIAIHSQGSGDGIESRQQVQDFGHQGDGFWLQGGNVSVTNNVVSGQRHSGYVFFPVGLNQKGLGVATISGANLASYPWADPTKDYAVGDVPLKEFKGNVAFASGDGFESWFSLLNAKHTSRTVVEDFKVFDTNGTGVFDPYTNDLTFKNVELTGNLANPGGTAFNRNDVTRNIIYDHVHAEGWNIGINAPVNGKNQILGGTFNDLRNIYITTANSRDRVVAIDDAGPGDAVVFRDNLTKKVNGQFVPREQWDIYLQTNYNPMENDITRIFNPDIIRMGLVTHNGAQVYYNEQAADFIPFPTVASGGAPAAAAFVPAELRDKTNKQLFAQYGLAIGGIVAPDNAWRDPRINGLVGAAAVYLPDLQLLSRKYTNDLTGYKLSYKYFDTPSGKYATVHETTATPLHQGWNLLTRTIAGATRTLLVYGDITPPTFQLNPNVPLVVNQADIDNGSTFLVQGFILDDSFGKKDFRMGIKLNDPNHVKLNGDGTLTITFTISDLAGNTTVVSLTLTISHTATLIKDLGRLNLPTIQPSETLLALLDEP